jgi:hypothetical protein
MCYISDHILRPSLFAVVDGLNSLLGVRLLVSR